MKKIIYRLFGLKKFKVFYFNCKKYSVPMDYQQAKSYAEVFDGRVELI